MAIHFWQCSYCLMIGTTQEPYNAAICGVCEQRVNYLGYAKADKLMQDVDKCPCDGRCTGARGPNCDCQCSGANHGSGKLVTVSIEVGKLPRLTPKNQDYEEAVKRAKEYKELRQAIKEALVSLQDKRDNGTFIPKPQFMALIRASSILNKIGLMKLHNKRIKALEAFHKELTGELANV